MIPWVHAIVLGAVIIGIVIAIADARADVRNKRHEHRMAKLEHRHDIDSQALDAELPDPADDDESDDDSPVKVTRPESVVCAACTDEVLASVAKPVTFRPSGATGKLTIPVHPTRRCLSKLEHMGTVDHRELHVADVEYGDPEVELE